MNNRTRNNLKYGFGALAFLLISFAIFILPEVIKSNRIFSTLHKDGLITDAIVVERFIRRNSNTYYYIVICKYFVDGLVYTTKERAVDKNVHQAYDTLKIVYSEHDPTVYRIIDPHASYDIELMDSIMIRLAQINLQQ